MISKKEADSAVLEEAAAAFLVVSDQVDNAASSVVSARHQLVEAEEHEGADEDAADETAKNHGEGRKKGRRCTAELKLALARFNISVQRYWNGSLVGPDCTLFTDNFIDVLTQVHLKIDELFPGSSKALFFFDRHAQVLQHVHVFGHLSRKVAMLTAGELDALETACLEFGRSFRLSY